MASLVWLSGCVSERHFVRDSAWLYGNPNAPVASSETAQRALGHSPDVTIIAPQPGNVWPGPVKPVPTIADEEAQMSQPLGDTYTPSLPSPYPPGETPPPDADLNGNYTIPSGGSATPLTTPGAAPSAVPGDAR